MCLMLRSMMPYTKVAILYTQQHLHVVCTEQAPSLSHTFPAWKGSKSRKHNSCLDVRQGEMVNRNLTTRFLVFPDEWLLKRYILITFILIFVFSAPYSLPYKKLEKWMSDNRIFEHILLLKTVYFMVWFGRVILYNPCAYTKSCTW